MEKHIEMPKYVWMICYERNHAASIKAETLGESQAKKASNSPRIPSHASQADDLILHFPSAITYLPPMRAVYCICPDPRDDEQKE